MALSSRSSTCYKMASTEISIKKQKKLENKKRKIMAFLEMAKVNDEDRRQAVNSNNYKRACEDNSNSECESKALKRNRLDKTAEKDTTEELESSKNPVKLKQNYDSSGKSKKKLSNKDELAELRKKLRERQFTKLQKPLMYLTKIGLDAHINETKSHSLFIQDIQNLILCSLIGRNAPYKSRWCKLIRLGKISHVTVLIIEGLSLRTYLTHKECFAKTMELFDMGVSLSPPIRYNYSVAEELLVVPVSLSKKNNLETNKTKMSLAYKAVKTEFRECFPIRQEMSPPSYSGKDKFPRTDLLLSPADMLMEGYPLPVEGEFSKLYKTNYPYLSEKELNDKFKNYVFTKDEYKEVTNKSPLFGVDCEMCETVEERSALTRVTIVDEQLNNIFDELVKPKSTITNYLTKYSGITPKMMENVTTTLSDVQKKIRELLPANAILCGQSLQFDLRALKMFHPYIIDTSLIYNITGNPRIKTKLKTLTSLFLKETIQDDYVNGHCSFEDSAAALKLVKLKLNNSLDYGDVIAGGFIPYEAREYCANYEIPLELQDKTGLASSFYNYLLQENQTVALVGRSKALRLCGLEEAGFSIPKNVSKYCTEKDKEVPRLLGQQAINHNFSLGLMALSNTEDDLGKQQKRYRRLDKRIAKVYDDIAPNSLFVVIFSELTADCERAVQDNFSLIKIKI